MLKSRLLGIQKTNITKKKKCYISFLCSLQEKKFRDFYSGKVYLFADLVINKNIFF